MEHIDFPGDFPSFETMMSVLKKVFEKSWKVDLDIEDINLWLGNFTGTFFDTEDERRLALWMLCNFTYYNDAEINHLIIFLGFEGVLASKVTEDIQYEELLLVNNLPSFFPKYKDICVINNYDLLSTHRSKLLYVPANNPFETFNFLDSVFDGKSSLCVAPLSTKPVALGVCLYAMSHKTLRIVYPTSEHYNDHRTNKVLNTNIYSIPLQSI